MHKNTCVECGESFETIMPIVGHVPVCPECAFDARAYEGFSYQKYDIGFTAGQEILRSGKPSAAALEIIDRIPERYVSRHGFGGVTVYAYATEQVDGKPYLSPGRNPLFDELKEAK